MADISRIDDDVVMRMSAEESRLLSLALETGLDGMSRAEFWIRSGVSLQSVLELEAGLYAVGSGERSSVQTLIQAGTESEENPRRPRPPTSS